MYNLITTVIDKVGLIYAILLFTLFRLYLFSVPLILLSCHLLNQSNISIILLVLFISCTFFYYFLMVTLQTSICIFDLLLSYINNLVYHLNIRILKFHILPSFASLCHKFSFYIHNLNFTGHSSNCIL